MGAINYYTSNYVTLGYNLSNDYTDEFETFEEAQEQLNLDIEWAADEIERIFKKYNFYYYNITIEPGYYEGFSIDIENNFPLCFDDYYSKNEVQKEITQIKKFLLECLDYDLCVVHPGWCTSYLDYNDSIKEIKNAISEMRLEVKTIPTWYQYQKEA